MSPSLRCLGVLLIIALFSGCFADTRPKQKLLFLATPLLGASSTQLDMERVKDIVTRRLRAAQLKASFTVEIVGPDKVTVTTRGADQDELDKITEQVTASVLLEFAAVSHPGFDTDLIALANDADKQVEQDGAVWAEWLPIALEPTGQPRNGMENVQGVVTRDRDVAGEKVREWLILYTPEERVTGDLLSSASEGFDESGTPAILFTLDADGSRNMSALTSKLRPRGATTRQLAIILNGTIYSAPTVQSTIGSRGQITGFSQKEVRETVEALRFGSVPCQLKFVQLSDESESQ
jgi:preprotein translocase subunit SecD